MTIAHLLNCSCVWSNQFSQCYVIIAIVAVYFHLSLWADLHNVQWSAFVRKNCAKFSFNILKVVAPWSETLLEHYAHPSPTRTSNSWLCLLFQIQKHNIALTYDITKETSTQFRKICFLSLERVLNRFQTWKQWECIVCSVTALTKQTMKLF